MTGLPSSPRGGFVAGQNAVSLASVNFVNTTVGSENLHLQAGSSAPQRRPHARLLLRDRHRRHAPAGGRLGRRRGRVQRHDRSAPDEPHGGSGRRVGGARVAHGVRARQPRLPRLPRPRRGRSVDAGDDVAHPGSRLVGDGPGVCVPGRGPRERHSLLLPAGGRRRVVADDFARPGVGRSAGRRVERCDERRRGESPDKGQEGRDGGVVPRLGAVGLRVRHGSAAARRPRSSAPATAIPTRCRSKSSRRIRDRRCSSCGRAASIPCARRRAACASSSPASSSHPIRRRRRCPSAAPSWTRSWAVVCSSAGSVPWTR